MFGSVLPRSLAEFLDLLLPARQVTAMMIRHSAEAELPRSQCSDFGLQGAQLAFKLIDLPAEGMLIPIPAQAVKPTSNL
jgi:hypothetical protein